MIRVAAALALLTATAHAQSTPVLGPGQEQAVLQMLDVAACELRNAQIDRDRIIADYRCPEPQQIVLRHPSESDSEHRSERFALETDAPSELVTALIRSLRQHESNVEWSGADPEPSTGTRWLTWPLMAVLLVVALVESRPSRAWLVLVPVALAMLMIPDWGPLHEHLTFTARSDCALIGCERERPGWLAPTYHAYRVLFCVVPYSSLGLSALSAALTFVGLLAQLAWLRVVAPRAALLSVLLCGLHPIALHASVAHSFWPLALALFWTGAWLSERESPRARLGGACAWALAGATSVAMVGPVLIFVARTAWKDRKRAWTALPVVAFIALHATPFFASMEGGVAQRLHPLHFLDHGLFDPRVSPFGFTLLIVAGAWLARRSSWGLALTLAIVSALPAVGEPIETGFPVGLLHAFPLVALAAPLAAFAWTATPTKLRALPVALVVLSAPTSVEAWQLELQPVAREQQAIERALSRLPPHERLVIAPEILEPMTESWMGDPIEVRFPIGFYRERGFDAEIVTLDSFERDSRETLVYVGTSLVSFHPGEIDDRVRADPRRPLLRRLGELEPVVTFEIRTESHPWGSMRVTGDTRETVELGFHRLR